MGAALELRIIIIISVLHPLTKCQGGNQKSEEIELDISKTACK